MTGGCARTVLALVCTLAKTTITTDAATTGHGQPLVKDRFDNSTCGGYPVMASNANYLIYNRINKAGSTTMQHLFDKTLSEGKKITPVFEILNFNDYFPNESTMLLQLGDHTERKTVYINHAFLLPQLPLDKFAWINVAREPLERLLSAYYYTFDVAGRGRTRVEASLQKETRKGKCGCDQLEFGDCIEALVNNKCTLPWRPQYSFFCPAPKGNAVTKSCGSEEAIANIRRMYSFIGLTSQLPLSMDVFAKMVPKFMSQFPTYMASGSKNHFKQHALTNTSQKRVLSNKHKALLQSQWPHYATDVAVYKEIERLFWCKVKALGF